MYERPDVPKDNPHRNVIAAIVLAVIAVSAVVLVIVLWNLAQQHSKLGDTRLTNAVERAATVALPQQEGVRPTGDSVTTTLVAMLSDDESSDDIVALRLASLDTTKGTSMLVDVPLDVTLGGKTVADAFAKGTDKLVSEFAKSAGLPVAHVVVVRQGTWDALVATAAKGTSALVKAAPDLMGGVVRSDMGAQDLLDLAKNAAKSKLGSTQQVTVPTTTNDAGATVIDPVQLGLLVGTLAQG